MSDPLSGRVFVFEGGKSLSEAYDRCLARDLGLPESWMRDAIFADPQLIAEPCRAAGISGEDWYPWAKEYPVAVGFIDVLLLSSQGRVAIVETKLSGNPELRRQVLAQALDYLAHLPDALAAKLPPIPVDENGHLVTDAAEIQESVQQGDVLVVIASDRMDERATRLGHTLLGGHLTKPWDLVQLDLALYRRLSDRNSWLIVPCVRGLVMAETRQVVRVVVEGETPRARIEVERFEADNSNRPGRQRWSEARFFEQLEKDQVPRAVRELAANLRDLAERYSDSLTVVWGTGRTGSMVLKRHGHGLVELYGSGQLGFRPGRFKGALGDEVGADYFRVVADLFPEGILRKYVPSDTAARNAAALFAAVRTAVERVDRPGESNVV